MSQQTSTPDSNAAQQAAHMQASPEKQHRWLQKLVGEWTYETDASAPTSEKASGTERVRQLGDLWVLAEGEGRMPGGIAATTLMTLGYDPAKGRFVGTWIGSMMTHLWVYDGELDPAGRVLTLNSEGPSMTGDGSLAKYQDIVEFMSDDHRVLTARAQATSGGWQQLMMIHYRRKK
jgi:uncharacterized protein DUF1579